MTATSATFCGLPRLTNDSWNALNFGFYRVLASTEPFES